MKILGIITARGGSKGIPGKNIKLLGGMPLLSYVANDALSSKSIARIVISTDDPEIAKVAKSLGIEVPFMRPAELAQDHTPSIAVIKHCIEFFLEKGEQFDAICLLQPTSPFKPVGFIDECSEEFIRSKADCLISVLPVPHHINPHWVFEEDNSGLLKIATGENALIPRRQELPPAYYRDGSVYLFKVDNILKENTIVHGDISFKISDEAYYCNLDTIDDWKKAEMHPLGMHSL